MSRKWIVLVAIAASACGGKSDVEARYQKAVAAQRAASGGAADELVSIGKSGNDVNIVYFEKGVRHDLQGVGKSGGDRTYSIDSGKPVLGTASRDYGFKVRDAAKNVRWKVRLYPEKIKISDNDNDLNPVRVHTRAPDRAEVEDDAEKPVGTVKWEGGKTVVADAAGKVRFTRATAKLEPAYAVMLLDKMTPPEKYIVIAELNARGR